MVLLDQQVRIVRLELQVLLAPLVNFYHLDSLVQQDQQARVVVLLQINSLYPLLELPLVCK